jgi:hypothetical protein
MSGIPGHDRVDAPQQACTEQGRGRFIDFYRMLESDRRISKNENEDQQGVHEMRFSLWKNNGILIALDRFWLFCRKIPEV